MIALCDTCSILMLLRIAPEMFRDNAYECITITWIKEEIVRTQKFKNKYTWLKQYQNRIKTIGANTLEDKEFETIFAIVDKTIKSGKVNPKTGKLFDLSYRDKKVISAAAKNGWAVASEDGDLADYYRQEFDGEVISVLKLLNDWIEKGLISWNDNYKTMMEEWKENNERPQPRIEIERFEKLTKFKYCGT